MKLIIVLACIFAAAHGIGDWKEGHKVRFGMNVFGFGSSYFVDMPRTVAQAKNARWVLTARPVSPLPSLVMYCPSLNDRTVCAFYDDTNTIAGLQTAMPEEDFKDTVFDWEVQGYRRWEAPANSNGVVKTYWTQQQYYVSEASLAKSVEERLAARANNRKILHEGSVWVSGYNGDLLEISADAAVIDNTAVSGFTKQACVVLMGRHYYYNMTAYTECTADGLLPWFPLVHSGEMIGLGLVSFGKLDEKALTKDYFERPDRSAVEMIVPDGPECLYQLAENPGLVTQHTYFIDAPWLIQCIGQ